MNRTILATALAAVTVAALGACSSGSETERAVDEASAAASDAAAAASEAAEEVEDEIDDAVEQVTAAPTAPPAGETQSASFHTAAGYATVVKEMAAAVGTPDPRIVDLNLFPGHFVFSAVNPQAPTELDEYTYVNGAMTPPRPVDYGGDPEALEANLFAASVLTPDAVERFAAAAVRRSEVEGGALQHVVVRRGLPFTEDVQLIGYVTSDRDSATVTGSVDGRVTEVG